MKEVTHINGANARSGGLSKFLQFTKANKNIFIQYSSLILVFSFFMIMSNGDLLSVVNLQTIIRQLLFYLSLQWD